MTKKDKKIMLIDRDIGCRVTYFNKHQGTHEDGKLKSFDNESQVAFVVYDCGGNRQGNQRKEYTAQMTRYEDLHFYAPDPVLKETRTKEKIVKDSVEKISNKITLDLMLSIKPKPRWMPSFIYNAVIRNQIELKKKNNL